MSEGKDKKPKKARVYKDGKLVKEKVVRGGPARGYVGKDKATEFAKRAQRKAS